VVLLQPAEGDAVTEYEWSRCDDPDAMMSFLRGPEPVPQRGMLEWLGLRRRQMMSSPSYPPSKRKIRLLACACCRRIGALLREEPCERAVTVSERFADGLATERELADAWHAAHDAAELVFTQAALAPLRSLTGEASWKGRAWAVRAAVEVASLDAPAAAISSAIAAALESGANGDASTWSALLGSRALTELMRDVFGPLLFRPIIVLPAWLSHQVVALAEAAYEERTPVMCAIDNDHLAVLADDLEKAGCDNEEILTHLRDPAADHVRGCFALDLVLGRS
jgi:hypothetical protein